MTKQLKTAIENLYTHWKDGGGTYTEQLIKEVWYAYQSQQEGLTDTQFRIDFLREKLEEGMSKRNAAKALCIHDPRVGPQTAETIVYTAFSGMYQTSQRGRKGKTTKVKPLQVPDYIPPSSSDDDAGML